MQLMEKGGSRDGITTQELLPGPACSLPPSEARQSCRPGSWMPSL